MSEILELLSLDLNFLGTKAKKETQLTTNFTVCLKSKPSPLVSAPQILHPTSQCSLYVGLAWRLLWWATCV